MYFSNRELKILRLMMQMNEGVTIDEIMHVLQVSKRTVYRELSKLESTLHLINLDFERSGKYYHLKGSQEALRQLFDQLSEPLAIEWLDIEKRQTAIFASIALQEVEEYTPLKLAEEFDVSLTTIQQDINNINDVIAKYNIKMNREENNILYLTGNEVYIRLYLSQILSNEINEFDFFNSMKDFHSNQIETESEYLLSLIDSQILFMVYKSFESEQPEIFKILADDKLMYFVLMVSISLMRLLNGHSFETRQNVDHNQLLGYMQQVLSIVRVFDKEYKELINTMEVSFLAMQLRGMNTSQKHSIFQDSYDIELGYSIKYLIKLVSNDLQFNFNTDDVLYHDLVNHIGAALKRLDLNLPEMQNSVLLKLKAEYPKLHAVIEEKLIEVFSPAIFSDQEIGYIVTHFASSFEKKGYQNDIRVLVVCTSGIGTSKILKARLERSIPNINNIEVVRAVDLEEMDIHKYEVIFSTIELPRFEYEYHMINPILDDQDIERIKSRIKQYRINSIDIPLNSSKHLIKNDAFKKVKRLVEIADIVIRNFEIIEVNQAFIKMNSFLDYAFSQNIKLKNKLERRLNESPLAIPDTGIMLLHTTDESIQQPVVKIYNLTNPIKTLGMDRQETKVNRIILMLAQENMRESTAELLGAISSSIIEKEDYTKLYQNGSTEELKQMIEQITIDLIRTLVK